MMLPRSLECPARLEWRIRKDFGLVRPSLAFVVPCAGGWYALYSAKLYLFSQKGRALVWQGCTSSWEELTGSIAERSPDNLLIMSCGGVRLDENLGKGLVG